MGDSPFNRSIWQGLSRAFRRLGHEVSEVDDHAVPEPRTLPLLPELLFAVHGGRVPGDLVDRYRAAGVLTAIYLLDEPYEVDRSRIWSRHYDWVFSVDRVTLPLHALHARAAFLPLGYDDEVFHPEGSRVTSDILMLGSPYHTRTGLLEPLLGRWAERVTWVGPGWREFSASGRHVEEYVSPEICARFYRGAAVVINIHRDSGWSHWGRCNKSELPASHLNPRSYEAPACGAFVLSTPRADGETYAPDMVTFKDAESLSTQLDYYLEAAEVRRELAARVHAQIAPHRYLRRAETALSLMALAGEPMSSKA
jgi:spore maturation protein CgeB